MRLSTRVFQLWLLGSTSYALPSDTSPFYPAFLHEAELFYTNSNDTLPLSQSEDDSFDLLKRQTCPSSYNSCSTINVPGACCNSNNICSLDNAGQPACCPIGSFCTGTISLATASGTTAVAGVLTITSNGFVYIVTTSTPAVVIATTTATPTTYVQNAYGVLFPYIPTTYANSAACAAAYSGCVTNYAACTATLQGAAGIGVTVSVPGGGGITVVPATGVASLPAASASSVCSSLSSVACPGNPGTCAVYGTATSFVAIGGAEKGIGRGTERWWVGGLVGMVVWIVGWVL